MATVTKILETIVNNGRRVIKVLGLGNSAARTAHLLQPFGEDSNPVMWMPIYAKTDNEGQPVIIGFINPQVSVELGEKKIFSTDADGVESFFIYMKNDGTAQVGGQGDFMVRYNELETAFNQLKDDFNDLVTKYNAHVHPGVVTAVSGGSGSPAVGTVGNTGATTSTDESSTADITPAKIEEITTIPKS